MPPYTRDIPASCAACAKLVKRRRTPGKVRLVTAKGTESPRWSVNTAAAAAEVVAAAEG